MGRYAIIMAAGKGTRMKSSREDISKVSFPILGKPMVGYVLDALKGLNLDRIVTIVGFGGEMTKSIVEKDSEVVWQKEQKGTGHAVMMASDILSEEEGETIICCGDTPLLTGKTLSALLSSHETNHNDLTLMTAIFEDPHGYGRIVKKNGRVVKIVEQKDCSIEEDTIHEVNAGVYVFNNKELFKDLKRLTPNNAAGEYYLTDVISMFVKDGKKVDSFAVSDAKETMGVNDRYNLSKAEKIIRHRINKKWMLAGVSMDDPDTTYIGPDVKLSQDCVIRPNTMILGNSRLGKGNVVGPNSYLENVEVGENNVIEYSHITDSSIGNGNNLGPFLRVRQNCVIENNIHLGNFNELKNVTIKDDTWCMHLSYLGDADIGKNVNIGCGSIIANYDGVNKTHSSIGDNAFIGSGTILISPITVGESSFTGAGSVINKDVSSHDFAIARARQENKEGYADTLKEKALKKASK
ncbi:MAG: bifunctional UDP-N-acetylglucosamine diphosphorylase/glucosamine-1-phosphate N-acetyltransferase GlmU [Bacilli bacterium]|nr:bifunctional UDP-N-acetylglucosamine diphosphorylase/glucosamine-1-phosphate N-acetyltransferase GlmU [Bacilli bacterium]